MEILLADTAGSSALRASSRPSWVVLVVAGRGRLQWRWAAGYRPRTPSRTSSSSSWETERGMGAPLVIPGGCRHSRSPPEISTATAGLTLQFANRGTTAPLGSSDVAILLGAEKDCTFSGPTRYPGAELGDVAVGDIDRDRGLRTWRLQINLLPATDLPALPSRFCRQRNRGVRRPLELCVDRRLSFPGPIAVVLGDFNRDGQLDAAVGDSGSRIWIYLACAAIPVGIPTLGPVGLIVMGTLVALGAIGLFTARS